MKTLSCKDMGKSDDYTARGFTSTEVVDDMVEHMKESHPEEASKSDDELRAEARSKIKEE